MRANTDSPLSANAHTFDSILEAWYDSAATKAKLTALRGLNDLALVQGERVRDLNASTTFGNGTVTNREVLELNAAASFLHRNDV